MIFRNEKVQNAFQDFNAQLVILSVTQHSLAYSGPTIWNYIPFVGWDFVMFFWEDLFQL